jgi:hypothetical protein
LCLGDNAAYYSLELLDLLHVDIDVYLSIAAIDLREESLNLRPSLIDSALEVLQVDIQGYADRTSLPGQRTPQPGKHSS